MTRARAPLVSEASASRRLIVGASTSRRLDAAREWLAALPRDADALILAPHAHVAHELVQADAAASGTRFGAERQTLDRLAARIALPELARRGLAPATALSLAAVVTRAVHRLLESGAAARYATVGRRPGFPHAAVRTLQELRAAGIDAAAVARLPLGADLAEILERVERELEELRLADRATILDLARVVVERDGPRPTGTPLLLLDLSPEHELEVRLLQALVARAPTVLATVPRGDAATRRRFEPMLGVAATPLEDPDSDSLMALRRHLFEDTSPEPRPLDDGVSLTSWPGEARECVEIARRIQAEAARGTPFDAMAIFLRAPALYRAHVEEALRRASIPAYFARGTTRPEPAGRALLALLACAADGLSARRFAEYLSLAQVPDSAVPSAAPWSPPRHELLPFEIAEDDAPEGADSDRGLADPDAAVLEGSLRAPWRWERLLVDAAVIGGRDRWRRRLDGWAQEIALQRRDLAEDDARAQGLERAARDLEHLTGFALPIIDRLAALPSGATWGVWLEHLRELVGAAIRGPANVLAVLAELEPLEPVGPVDLAAVQHVLAPRLRELTVPPERRPQGAVFVAPVEAARGLAFDVVFVPGMAEKVFPPRIVQDPLLTDDARAELAKETLPNRDSRGEHERLALRVAAGAARRHLALSWPRIDLEKARQRVPSFYVLEAMSAAEGTLPELDELRTRSDSIGGARLGWPAPEKPEDAIDEAEYDISLLAKLRHADKETSRGAAHYLLHANPVLARALAWRLRRSKSMWTSADGLVPPHERELSVPGTGPAATERYQLATQALTRHRMGARSFSPTALEHFASCPYRFLLQAIHRLQPRQESEALETIDPLTRGALFHEVQFQVLTGLRDGGHLPLDPARLETAFEHLDRAVDRVANSYKERLAPAIPRVWQDGVQTIRADLREWLRRSAEGASGWVPHRFELSFGLKERSRPTADAASVDEPVAILSGALLRGSIDLVERRADGTLRVTDHKTGKVRAAEHAVVGGGKVLQPLLYAHAAEKLLGAPVESGRLYYCTADGDFTERVIPLDDLGREHVTTALGVIADALDRGFLPAAPAADACTWCDYRPVCGPSEESRTADKSRDALVGLERLRGLP
jgi:RecB family exonuclease